MYRCMDAHRERRDGLQIEAAQLQVRHWQFSSGTSPIIASDSQSLQTAWVPLRQYESMQKYPAGSHNDGVCRVVVGGMIAFI